MGPGWWQASDGNWYPPELHPDYVPPLAQPTAAATGRGPAAAAAPTNSSGAPPARRSRNGVASHRAPKAPAYKRWWFWTVAALVVVVVVAVTTGGTKKGTADPTPATAPTAVHASTPPTVPAATGATTTSPPTTAPLATTAVFSCTGTAPEGVSITYGTDTSNLNGASTVPWQASLPLPSTAEYANVSAQLQGPDGSIRCTTTVTWSSDGRSHTVSQSGSAAGDYNIASAQVCTDQFNGNYTSC